jgi:hypothetical protein
VWVQIAHLVARDQTKATQPLRSWFNRVAEKRGKKTERTQVTEAGVKDLKLSLPNTNVIH